jgi:carbonic anhydrase/acetyltransferase-like protein (isoleucine patch superfamily)
LNQRDVLAPYIDSEFEVALDTPIPNFSEPCLVYRDNLYFDQAYIDTFLKLATKKNKPSQAAFSRKDKSFIEHALPLSVSYTERDDIYLSDLWFYPNGPRHQSEPLIIDLESAEAGYYHVPTYMASESGDLIFHVPHRSLIAIDSWVHIFIADVIFGLFTRGAQFEDMLNDNPFYKFSILSTAMFEGKQVLDCSKVVRIGRNCSIDPTAIIHGPTTIGDNVSIGAGAVIENCIIGSHVNISQGCNLTLSVIGDGVFLPFRASLFMTTLMDNSMVAQNSCLQMCVIGRNSFLGAGSTFTDFNLIPTPIRATAGDGKLKIANRPVLGGCVGHNCRIGAGMVIFPARTIESDVVLVPTRDRRVIYHDVRFEQSDHHSLEIGDKHEVLYRPERGNLEDSW